MKKMLIAMLMVVALAIPAFGQELIPLDVEGRTGKALGADASVSSSPYTFQKLYLYSLFTTDDWGYPYPVVFPGWWTSYNQVYFEFNTATAKENILHATVKITGTGYSNTDTYELYFTPGMYGIYSVYFPIDSYGLLPGYYKVSVKLSCKGLGSKTLKTTFRVINYY